MQINSLKLRDFHYGNQWFDQVEHQWVYDDFVADKDWKKGWISFDCALYNLVDDRVYLGITCFDSDNIFQAYDRKTGEKVWETRWDGAMKVPFFAAKNGSWIRSTPAGSRRRCANGAPASARSSG